MDRLLIALLNTALEEPDPLETPLGTARWWSQTAPPANPLSSGGKPRFDAGLARAVRTLREDVLALAAGEAHHLTPTFRGDGGDEMLFELAYAVRRALDDGSLRRIRRCPGPACGRYFADETKNRSKRWCSLRCMERARAPRRRTITG